MSSNKTGVSVKSEAIGILSYPYETLFQIILQLETNKN